MRNKMSKHDLIETWSELAALDLVFFPKSKDIASLYEETLRYIKISKYFDFRNFLAAHIINYNQKISFKESPEETSKNVDAFINGLELDIDLMSSILFISETAKISVFMPYKEVLFRIHD